MSYREDFIKRLIRQFVQLIHQVLGLVEENKHSPAMRLIVEAYQELIGLEPSLVHSLDAQALIGMTGLGDEPDVDKVLVMAELLKVEGDIYAAKDDETASYERYLKALDLRLHIHEAARKLDYLDQFSTVFDIAQALGDYVLPEETQVALFTHYEKGGQYAAAEEALFDLIEESNNPGNWIEAGLAFCERLLTKSDEELAAGELERGDVDEMENELREKRDLLSD
jgi:tetratricopeptide (TPR) repeat protein